MSEPGDHIHDLVENVPIGRELGILFGFLLASLVIMAVYAVLWRVAERRDEEQERLRRGKIDAQRRHYGRSGIHEVSGQEFSKARAELPVNEISELNLTSHSQSPPRSLASPSGNNGAIAGMGQFAL